MKNLFKSIFITILLMPTFLYGLEDLELHSKNVIVYNMDENKVIYEENSEEVTSIASLTKIMTTIVAIENIKDLNEKVTITEEMLEGIPWDASIAGLEIGDVLTYEDLLYSSMIPSGADATQALAVSLTGSVQNFVKLMNQKAKELNLKNTNFVNTTGLDQNGHYGTARDIVELLKYSLKNELFSKIYQTKNYTTTNGIKLESTLDYYNNYLDYNLSFIKGSKTGYTDDAGLCLSTKSVIDGVNILTVTIGAPYTYGDFKNIIDIKSIYNSLQENYSNIKLIEEDEILVKLETKNAKEDFIYIRSTQDINKYLEKPYDKEKLEIKYEGEQVVSTTTKPGTKIGSFKIYYNNELMETIDAVTSDELHFSVFKYLSNNIVYYIGIIVIIILTFQTLRKPKKKKIRKRR